MEYSIHFCYFWVSIYLTAKFWNWYVWYTGTHRMLCSVQCTHSFQWNSFQSSVLSTTVNWFYVAWAHRMITDAYSLTRSNKSNTSCVTNDFNLTIEPHVLILMSLHEVLRIGIYMHTPHILACDSEHMLFNFQITAQTVWSFLYCLFFWSFNKNVHWTRVSHSHDWLLNCMFIRSHEV